MYTNLVTEELIRDQAVCGRNRCECRTNGGNVHCPIHDDTEPSMSVTTERGTLLIKCHSGCLTPEILKHYRSFLPPSKTFVPRNPDPIGLTIQKFADAKGFDVSFLLDNYISEIQNFNHPALSFEYIDETGGLLATRIRLTMSGSKKFIWKTGSSARDAGLYGRWRMKDAYEKGYVFLCEGESDCLTLWTNGYPAIGLPGVSVWNESLIEESLADLRIKTIYAFIEPDTGGTTMLRNLGRSTVSDKIKLIFGGSYKDFSEMWTANRQKFQDSLKNLMDSSYEWEAYQKIARIVEHVLRENGGKMPSVGNLVSIQSNTSKRGMRYARKD